MITAASVMNILERYESLAQNYMRMAPIVFDRACGSEIFDENGARYIDFHSGGGTLTLGHNHPKVCTALVDYLCNDGVPQTRDRASVAKRRFVEAFVQRILAPRGLDYKLLFTDPASGVAAEFAMRLARRDRKRASIIAFTNSSHGLTEGALAATAKPASHYESLNLRGSVMFMPYCNYLGAELDTIRYLRRHLEDRTSGVEPPAAVIVEPVQYDGGVVIASGAWLKALEQLCREFGMLLILDESLTGCGRTGPYFAFERAGIRPDMVLAPLAMAGGRPLSLLLMRSELDHWRPGEQAGLFQGDCLAITAATELLSLWTDDSLSNAIAARAEILAEGLKSLAVRFPARNVEIRGIGMLWAIDFRRTASAAVVSSWALEAGLIVEPAAIKDEVLLIAPPVTIAEDTLRQGVERLDKAVTMFLSHE